jgi:DNA repair exonuclease SbcCD ATPase subunit
MGALVTIFFLIGGVVPGTAGQVEIDYDTQQLKEYKEKLKGLWNKETRSENDLNEVTKLTQIVNSFDDRLDKERRRQFSLAATLYVALGAFFATLLAHDILQAFVIGAGWTGYLGALGLKQDREKRLAKKDESIDALSETVDEIKKKLKKLEKPEAKPTVTSEAEPAVTSEAEPAVTSEAKPSVTSEAEEKVVEEKAIDDDEDTFEETFDAIDEVLMEARRNRSL